MFHLIITCDYELLAGGGGDVQQHVIGPTEELLVTCERFGAKFTIMAEMAEVWSFENPVNSDYAACLGYSPAAAIRRQLYNAVARGHDVQLHLHPQWVAARWIRPGWQLDYSHYRLTDFDQPQMIELLRRGKRDLEGMLASANPGYRCIGFRAGNWSTSPSAAYLRALEAAGFRSDTSVFKWGFLENGAAAFDYRRAHSNVLAWFTSPEDINQAVPRGSIVEVPIATEYVHAFRLLRPRRLSLLFATLRQDREIAVATSQSCGVQRSSGFVSKAMGLFGFYPRKLDFCKMSAGEMIHAIESLKQQCASIPQSIPIPIVMIGHCKDLPQTTQLAIVLRFLSDYDDVRFSTYQEFVSLYLEHASATGGVRFQALPCIISN